MTTANNTTTSTNFKLFVLFVLLVLSSTGAFAQANNAGVVAATTSTEVSISKDATIVISTENNVASMDFAVWFTGVKKTSTNSSNGTFSKKQLINAGITTNSVLVRSFLKKMNSQENGVA